MTELAQRRITKSGSKPAKRLPWNGQSESTLALRLQALKKLPLGSLQIVSGIYRNSAGYLIVDMICATCNQTRVVHVNNIEAGKTTDCKCNSNRKFNDPRSKMLSFRFSAIKQRCENPKNGNWPNYGGRGIKNKFRSSVHFVQYILKHLPHPTYKLLDIDRKNNDGHYEPGNLRLVTRDINLRNRRFTKRVYYKGRKIAAADLWAALRQDFTNFNLSKKRTGRLAAQGISWQSIVERKARGPYTRRSTTS